MKPIALVALGSEQGRLIEVSRTGINSVDFKSLFWDLYELAGSPDIALIYISDGSYFSVGLTVKARRQEGFGSQRPALPSFWGWMTTDPAKLSHCILSLLHFPSAHADLEGNVYSWIDEIIVDSHDNSNVASDQILQTLELTRRFNDDLSELAEIRPIPLDIGTGIKDRNGLTRTFFGPVKLSDKILVQIALSDCNAWSEDRQVIVSGFKYNANDHLASCKIERFPHESSRFADKRDDTKTSPNRGSIWRTLKSWR